MSFTPRYVGRMEKRIPIALVVHLARAQAQPANATELTYTDNVSAHGACVVSHRSWQPGEIAEVTSLKDETTIRGRVIHCQKRNDDRYRIGLTFQGRTLSWGNYSVYADA